MAAHHIWELPVQRHHGLRVDHPYPLLGVISVPVLQYFIIQNYHNLFQLLPFLYLYGKLPYIMLYDKCSKNISPLILIGQMTKNGYHFPVL